MDDAYFLSIMEDIPRALTARNIKMWQNYCAFRAGANVQAMPKTNDDNKYKEMEKAYTQHAEMLFNSSLQVLLPVGIDLRSTYYVKQFIWFYGIAEICSILLSLTIQILIRVSESECQRSLSEDCCEWDHSCVARQSLLRYLSIGKTVKGFSKAGHACVRQGY